MKKDKLLLRQYKQKIYFQRKTKKIKWKKYLLILMIMSSIFMLLLYFIFFSRKSRKISQKFFLNNQTSSNYNKLDIIDENKNLNNQTYSDYNKIDIINGRIIWNNHTALSYDKIREEVKNYEKIQISFENKDDFIKREKPKITIVITLYNQENYIKTIYASIQQQELKDIEIIFVDDCSTDNTTKKIEELMENDKRIVYLKNEINKKAFYSRYRGILNATGEYILVIDPDDLLLNNILIKAYETAKKFNLDIVQFYLMVGYPLMPHLWPEMKYKGGFLKNNSEVRQLFYYGTSRNLVDKLTRREIYLKSIKFMGDEFINEDYHHNDDDTAFFGLIHVAETYGFLEEIGYFYMIRPKKTTKSENEIANETLRSIFNIMKYFYMRSDNNEMDKSYTAYNYFKKAIEGYGKLVSKMTEGFNFGLDILNLYLNSTYFKSSQKEDINNFKTKMIDRQNQLK